MGFVHFQFFARFTASENRCFNSRPSGASGLSEARGSGSGGNDFRPAPRIAMRAVADHQVTVMGEVPLAAVQTIADGVTRRR